MRREIVNRLDLNGLSLCIQGTFAMVIAWLKIIRFIPVHTGNIKTAEQVRVRKAVYPCAYREHPVTITYSNVNPGLSLCIQGTLAHRVLKIQLLRFIPVHTGNIFVAPCGSIADTVYPCAYREHTNYNILFYN